MKLGEAAAARRLGHLLRRLRRDVTWLTKFDTNDAGRVRRSIAGRHGDGQAERGDGGPGRVPDRGRGRHRSPCRSTGRWTRSRFAARNNFIDDHVFAKLKELADRAVATSAPTRSSCRRAFLDAIGTLPTPAEVRAFVADTAAGQAGQGWSTHLLDRPEFIDYWTLFLSDLFQNRKERDHDVRGVEGGPRQFHDWLREQVAANRPWDELARDVLTATGDTQRPARPSGTTSSPSASTARRRSREVAESVAQAFLGTRIGCARCHNHPLERYTQDDFYHFAAFFSRVKLDRKDAKSGPTTLLSVGPPGPEPEQAAGRRAPAADRPVHRSRSRSTARPSAVEPRRRPAGEAGRRGSTDPKNERVRRGDGEPRLAALPGRRAGRAGGRPAGDQPAERTRPCGRRSTGSSSKHKYDLRHLMRSILTSRTYQLTRATRPGNAADARFYSHYYARRLPAEVLLDALGAATGTPREVRRLPGRGAGGAGARPGVARRTS